MHLETITIIALGVLLFGLVSGRMQRSIVTPPMAFTSLGVILGAAGLVALRPEGQFIDTLTELTLVLVLFTDATRINLSLFAKQYGLALRLLGIGLPLTILAGTLAGTLVFDTLSLVEVALIAAILAPTDAALGQAVVSSKRVPVRIRQTLNVESGLNDGVALPAVLFFLSLVGAETQSTASWLRFVSLQLLLAPVVGVFVGYVGGELVARATRTRWMNPTFTKLSAIALALLAYALAQLVGGNGFIAAFTAGLTLGNSKRELSKQLYDYADAEGQLLTLFVFLIFGAVMVIPALGALSWQIVVYALLSLTVVRMLPVALCLIGAGFRLDTVLFIGWFGPRGIASIIYGLLLLEPTFANGETIFYNVILTVLLSVFLHGMTAVPLVNLYGKRMEGVEHKDAPEMKDVKAMPLRLSASGGAQRTHSSDEHP